MPAGRPSKYDPAFCERVIELGKEGASVVEMCATIGVARMTLETHWPEQYPEFLAALDQARLHSQMWWEKTGRIGMLSKGIDSSIWSRSMAARFPKDWREKQAIVGGDEDDKPVTVIIRKIVDASHE